MKNRAMNTAFRLATLTAAIGAAFSTSASATEIDPMTELLKPESNFRLGVASVDADNRRFGQYLGLQESGVYGLADLDIVKRDDTTGTWYTLRGRNLGLDRREIGLTYGPQGKWKLFLEYREVPRESQYTINTGLQGIGTENLAVSPASKRDVVLGTKREKIVVGGELKFGENWSTQLRFTSEEKDGERLFGRGTSGTGSWNFLAEPIDSTISQWEASLAYTGMKFQLQGGYYGSQYSNHNTRLDITGGGAGLNGAGVNTLSPIALPPSNEAHQFFVNGGYNFTSTTRASFKLSYTNATQNDAFIGNPPGVLNTPTTGNTSGRTNLGGRVDTTIAYLALTSRPMTKLNLLASLRYEDRDDMTPEVQYINASGTNNHDGKNETRSLMVQNGKLEANYLLGGGFRLIAGVDHELKDRNTSDVRVVSHRDRTEESAWKLELRRLMSERVNGAVAYIRSDREGSDFEVNLRFNGTPGRNVLAPIHLADRDREKVRLSADWAPTDNFSVQLSAEDTRDDYRSRADLGLGARKGSSQLYSLDASFAISDELRFVGWLTHANTSSEQATVANTGAGRTPEAAVLTPAQKAALSIWSAALHNRTDAVGFGADLKVSEKLDLGARFEFSQDLAEYRLRHEQGTATNAQSLPDVKYQTSTLRLFGKYALQKNTGVRVDYVYDRRSINDWTWNAWEYRATTAAADGTTIGQDTTQRVHFLGVSAYYKWW